MGMSSPPGGVCPAARRFSPASRWRRWLAAPVLACLLLAGCDNGEEADSEATGDLAAPEVMGPPAPPIRMQPPLIRDLEQISDGGVLRVLTVNAPTTYYYGREGPTGPEYDLVVSFAESLGLAPQFEIVDSVASILRALEQGQGHLVAAGLTRNEAGREDLKFGPDYDRVKQQVVCLDGGPRPRSPADLVGLRLAVPAHTSFEQTLTALQGEYPDLVWDSPTDVIVEELLEMVWQGELDCTVADSNIVTINRRYHPELRVAFNLSGNLPMAWVVADYVEGLRPAIRAWLEEFKRSGGYKSWHERYYGHVPMFNYVDLDVYRQRIQKRLPRYEALFKAAGEAEDIPWTVLAGLAYQESKWDPRARSPTGVRGLMMLTQATARELGVKDRLDPRQSIPAGARYVRQMMDRLPEDIPEEDRLWMALATYNVGLGHMLDARTLARRLGKDPTRWADIKEVLPLLSRRKYYSTLRHGYARGGEPVAHVNRVRHYTEVLEEYLRRDGRETAAGHARRGATSG